MVRVKSFRVRKSSDGKFIINISGEGKRKKTDKFISYVDMDVVANDEKELVDKVKSLSRKLSAKDEFEEYFEEAISEG